MSFIAFEGVDVTLVGLVLLFDVELLDVELFTVVLVTELLKTSDAGSEGVGLTTTLAGECEGSISCETPRGFAFNDRRLSRRDAILECEF
jgi:hypothetical protein